MLALLTTVQNCASGVENSFCLWADPIRLKDMEIDILSDESVNQILYFNTNYEMNCDD
jgi:hypothetical protein